MKNSFERNRFRLIYIVVSVISLIAIYAVSYFTYGEFGKKQAVLFSIVAVILVVLYICLYMFFVRLLNEVENVSQIMENVIGDTDKELPSEEYKEGTVGMLYTKLYQMVGILKESRLWTVGRRYCQRWGSIL